MPNSEARERVLRAAETLFVERGYEAVTVKDIAKEAGIHHASIYHHIPGGKVDLYVEVMTRYLERHREGILAAIDDAGDDLRGQLVGIAAWLLSQAPMDMIRLTNSDIPAVGETAAEELENLAYFAMMIPIEQVLAQAQKRGEVRHPNMGNIAGAILTSVEGLHTIPPKYVQGRRIDMAEELIDVFIRGIAAT